MEKISDTSDKFLYFSVTPKELLYVTLFECRGIHAYNFAEFHNLDLPKLFPFMINEKLKTVFGKDVGIIKKYLNDNKVVISGSFIVQALLDENWDNSDIDFYVPTEVLENEYLISKPNTIELPDIDLTQGDDFSYQYLNTKEVLYIKDMKYKNIHKLQFLCLDKSGIIDDNYYYDSLWDYMCRSFDFNICKCMYYLKDGKEYIEIDDYKSIYSKIIEVFKPNTFTLIGRIHKYLNRGFTFSDIISDIKDMKDVDTNFHIIILERGLQLGINDNPICISSSVVKPGIYLIKANTDYLAEEYFPEVTLICSRRSIGSITRYKQTAAIEWFIYPIKDIKLKDKID